MSGLGDQLIIQYGPYVLQMLVEFLILPLIGVAFLWLRTKLKGAKMQQFLADIGDRIEKRVVAMNQDVVDALKKSGTFDKATQDAIFQTVMTDILEAIGQDSIELLDKYAGDGITYLKDTILYYVRYHKLTV